MRNDYDKLVSDFASLYRIVTDNITEHTETSQDRYVSALKNWIHSLVDGFQKRFEVWNKSESAFIAQISSRRSRVFNLTAFAFLHISKDLPIVLAENLDKEMHATHIFVHKKVYNSLEIPLSKSLNGNWSTAFWTRPFLKNKSLVQPAILHWMFNLRNRAWDNGLEILYAIDKDAAIQRLSDQVLDAMLRAQKKFWLWNKVLDLRIGLLSALALFMVMLLVIPFSIWLHIPSILLLFFSGNRIDELFEIRAQREYLSEFYFEFSVARSRIW